MDPEIWMKDCGSHYEYIVVWVDDLLVMSKDPMSIIEDLRKEFKIQSVGHPEYFLGADFKMAESPKKILMMGSVTYVKKILT